MEGYRFSTEVRVRFAETDAQGIAHHASFFVWCEVARIEWLDLHAGGYRRIREQGVLLSLAGADVLRFTPPLCVTDAELDEGLEVVRKVLREPPRAA